MLRAVQQRPFDGDDLAVGVARGVVALVLALLVEAPVLIEVSAGAESAKPQHGFGASEGPTRSGEVHAVRDQVAAGAFDHAGSDRESSGEALVVVQIRGVIEQIVSTLIHILPIVGRQLSSGGATSYPRRHQAGLTAQDAKQPLLDPHLAGAGSVSS